MEHVNKMMMVPAIRPDPSQQKLTELDKEMSLVLKNSKLSPAEKMKMYHQILIRNLAIENRTPNTPTTVKTQPQAQNETSAQDNNTDLIEDQNLNDLITQYLDEKKLSNVQKYQTPKNSNLLTPISEIQSYTPEPSDRVSINLPPGFFKQMKLLNEMNILSNNISETDDQTKPIKTRKKKEKPKAIEQAKDWDNYKPSRKRTQTLFYGVE
jgi:hypothetical protein